MKKTVTLKEQYRKLWLKFRSVNNEKLAEEIKDVMREKNYIHWLRNKNFENRRNDNVNDRSVRKANKMEKNIDKCRDVESLIRVAGARKLEGWLE